MKNGISLFPPSIWWYRPPLLPLSGFSQSQRRCKQLSRSRYMVHTPPALLLCTRFLTQSSIVVKPLAFLFKQVPIWHRVAYNNDPESFSLNMSTNFLWSWAFPCFPFSHRAYGYYCFFDASIVLSVPIKRKSAPAARTSWMLSAWPCSCRKIRNMQYYLGFMPMVLLWARAKLLFGYIGMFLLSIAILPFLRISPVCYSRDLCAVNATTSLFLIALKKNIEVMEIAPRSAIMNNLCFHGTNLTLWDLVLLSFNCNAYLILIPQMFCSVISSTSNSPWSQLLHMQVLLWIPL